MVNCKPLKNPRDVLKYIFVLKRAIKERLKFDDPTQFVEMTSFWRPFDEDDEQPVTQGRHWSVTTLNHLSRLFLLIVSF